MITNTNKSEIRATAKYKTCRYKHGRETVDIFGTLLQNEKRWQNKPHVYETKKKLGRTNVQCGGRERCKME